MNRKRASKEAEKEKKINYDSIYDDERLWPGKDFSEAPWRPEEVQRFQRRIDDIFGAKDAIILAWSGDKRYWDGFYTDWFSNGLPKSQTLEKQPILLFYRFLINEHDYHDVIVPRWMLLERLHPAQYASSWESTAWVEDEEMIGGRKRIRPKEVPQAYYRHLLTIAEHDDVTTTGDTPFCCRGMYENLNKICYGKYRPPSEKELEFVHTIRKNMDAKGIAQRNDEPISDRMLLEAQLSTKAYMEDARRRRAKKTRNFVMENIPTIFGDILSTNKLSAREIEECVTEGLNIKEERL